MPSLSRLRYKLQGQSFRGEVFEKQDLRSISAYNSSWEKCRFTECQMRLADFSNSTFIDSVFENCDMAVTSFKTNQLRRTRFFNCDLEQGIFLGAVIDDVEYCNSRLSLSTFFGATIRSVAFRHSNLHRADLRYIECNKAVYDDSVLWNAQIALGCDFMNGSFDERSADLFAAMLSRVHPNPEKAKILKGMAGKNLAVVERLMRTGTNV